MTSLRSLRIPLRRRTTSIVSSYSSEHHAVVSTFVFLVVQHQFRIRLRWSWMVLLPGRLSTFCLPDKFNRLLVQCFKLDSFCLQLDSSWKNWSRLSKRPWCVPSCDLLRHRLSYCLGFGLNREKPLCVFLISMISQIIRHVVFSLKFLSIWGF